MPRACFQLQVKPDRIAEYKERHAAVWPEMLRALHETGWHNYSLFLRTDGLLIGYVETPTSIAEAQAAMARTEVNGRWQAEMSEFFEELDGLAPDEASCSSRRSSTSRTSSPPQTTRRTRSDVR